MHFFLALYKVSPDTTPKRFAGVDLASTIPDLVFSSPPITAYEFLISYFEPFCNRYIAVHDRKALFTSILFVPCDSPVYIIIHLFVFVNNIIYLLIVICYLSFLLLYLIVWYMNLHHSLMLH